MSDIERVRELWKQGPFYCDPAHGMTGWPAVIGPIGIIGFQPGHADDAQVLCDQLNQAWAFGRVGA